MKSISPAKRRVLLANSAAAALVAGNLLLPGRAGAADVFKANNASALNLNSSWDGGSPPTSADVAVWDNRVSGANSVSLRADQSYAGLRILDPGGPVTLSNFTLTLGADGI